MKNYKIETIRSATVPVAVIEWKSSVVFLIPIAIIAATVILLLFYSRLKSNGAESNKQKIASNGNGFSQAIAMIKGGDYGRYLQKIGKVLEDSREEWSLELLREYHLCMNMAKREGNEINVAGSRQHAIMCNVVRGYLKHGGTIDVAETEGRM